MASISDFERQVEKFRSRIAFVAATEEDYAQKALHRCIRLADDVTLYTQLYCISEHSLLDIETNDISVQAILIEHASSSSVVWEFNVANGTNARLQAGETIVCLGKEEYVAMKLTEDDVVTYRSAASSLQLLYHVNELLEVRMHDAQE